MLGAFRPEGRDHKNDRGTGGHGNHLHGVPPRRGFYFQGEGSGEQEDWRIGLMEGFGGLKMNITIRPAAFSDAGALAAMNKQLIEDEKHDNPMTVPQLKERMEGFLSGDYTAVFCIGENADIIGYALINKTVNPMYLRQFFIRRDERRKGYGRQFFLKLLDYLNTDTIDIEVMFWNDPGKAFWESLRFKPRSVYMRYAGSMET